MFRLFNRSACEIGIDLGSANTLIYRNGQGIVLAEPSVVALECRGDRLIAAGEEASQLIGRSPTNMVLSRPLREGVIADFESAAVMLKHFVRKAMGTSSSVSRMVVGIPSGVTEVERRAVIETATHAGARSVHLIDEPLAAAIGAGLPVTAPVGGMIVDIGGGTTEVAVLCHQGCVASQSVRVAGDAMNECITQYLRKHYDLIVGEHTAEQLKIDLGSAFGSGGDRSIEVCGQDLLSSLPRIHVVHESEVRECIREPIRTIVDAVRRTLELTPPQLVADIYRRGIVLCGGGALLRGLDELLAAETGICVHIAESPLACVALGTGQVLENPQKWSRVLSAQALAV
ncbi:rod shape-determining protein [Gloeobacter morelensis]|uniref:Cell shape-determining protein MreB n=1 Tax=Gloeobacter morelensis MG652769 TaxID=2781736 RepID=A0ABY3PSF7_9CYAN|nr:rod shape-determining protein [Gloeobacter morelensis]UFP96544.1 rod shape-determining protein [Gloeobacter morelensis MG652769]